MRRRRLKGRIVAGMLAALMVVSVLPMDFVKANGTEGTSAAAADDTTTWEVYKKFKLTEALSGDAADTSSGLGSGITRGSNSNNEVIGGYTYTATNDSVSEKGEIVKVNSGADLSGYSFVFYSGLSKAGFSKASIESGTIDGESVAYTYEFNTQASMGNWQKAALETTIEKGSKVEIIWSTDKNDNQRWPVIAKKTNESTSDTSRTILSESNGVGISVIVADGTKYENWSAWNSGVVNATTKTTVDNKETTTYTNLKTGTLYKTTYTDIPEDGAYEIGSNNSGIHIYEIRISKIAANADDTDNSSSEGEGGDDAVDTTVSEAVAKLTALPAGDTVITSVFKNSAQIFGKDSIESNGVAYLNSGTDDSNPVYYVSIENETGSELKTQGASGHGITYSVYDAPANFYVKVAAGTVGTFKIKGCNYGSGSVDVSVNGKDSSSYEDGISVKVNDTSISESNCADAKFLYDSDSTSDNGEPAKLEITNNTDKEAVVKIAVKRKNETSANAVYIHSISYSVVAIPADNSTEEGEGEETADSYTVALKAGTNFEKLSDYKNTSDETLRFKFIKTDNAVDTDTVKIFKWSEITSEAAKSASGEGSFGSVSLPAGTWRLEIIGGEKDPDKSAGSTTNTREYNALSQIPYSQSYDNAGTVTIDTSEGATNTLTVSLTRITSWKFGKTNGFDQQLQNVKGYYNGLQIDATSGKLNGTSNSDNAQFNQNTAISVPVTGACKIKVVMYSDCEISFNGIKQSGSKEYTYTYTGKENGTAAADGDLVVIKAEDSGEYIKSIEILNGEVKTAKISGKVTIEGSSQLPETSSEDGTTILKDLKVVFTNPTGVTYYATISASDGSYAVNLPVVDDSTMDTYTVKLSNSDYSVSGTTSVTVTSDGETTGANITGTLMTFYKVNLTLEGLSGVGDNGAALDASGDSYTYTFTNTSTKEAKTFAGTGSIELPAGTYTVSVGGDFDKYPYDVTQDSCTVTVSNDDANHTLKFERVTKWLFGKNVGYGVLRQGSTTGNGYYKGLEIDATASGAKLNGERDNNAQINSGTIIYIPVEGACFIKVKTSYGAIDLNGTDAGGSTEFTYMYTGADAGNVTLTASKPEGQSNEYIYYIEVTPLSGTATVSGKVTVDGETTMPDGLTISLKSGTLTVPVTVSEGGSYSVTLPTYDVDTTYDIVLSDATYDLAGLTSVTVKAGDKELKDQNITIAKKVKHTITVRFGSGPDFEKIDASADTSTDASEDTTADAAEAALAAASAAEPTTQADNDSSKTKFVFTPTGSTGGTAESYTYTQVKNGEVQLYDGTYRVTIEGEAYHKAGYTITSDMQLVVDGADTQFAMTFEKAASWKLSGASTDTDDYYASKIQCNDANTSAVGYYNGLVITSSTKDAKFAARLTGGSKDTQVNGATTVQIPVSGKCIVTVSTKGSSYAQLVKLGVMKEGSYSGDYSTGDGNSSSVTYTYTSTDEGYVTLSVESGTAYLTSISVVYTGVNDKVDVTDTTGITMPSVATTDAIKGSTDDAMSVNAVGQKLKFSQAGGNFTDASGVSYYVFPITKDVNILDFDVVVSSVSDTSNNAGFFGGLFTETTEYTVAMRKASTSLRGVYTKSDDTYAGATGNESTITLGTTVHYNITVSGSKAVINVSYVDADGVTQTITMSQTMSGTEDGYYYGFAVANADAVVTNMTYVKTTTDEDTGAVSATTLYAQNNIYAPEGKAPVVDAGSVTATIDGKTASDGDVAASLLVSWLGDIAEYDGYYEVWVKIDDDAKYTKVAEDITGYSYSYSLAPEETHTYQFEVRGVLGKPSLGGKDTSAFVESAKTAKIKGQLAAPVVTATADSTAKTITLTWDAVTGATIYNIYRYSYDEGEGSASQVGLVKVADGMKYVDSKNLSENVPYYYYVTAQALDNGKSNVSDASETVWAVIATGHTGTYVYEDEATEIQITNKSYDTVLTDTAVLEGKVLGAGTISVNVNGLQTGSQTVTYGGTFSFSLKLNQGRNDVELLFTSSDNKITRKTYNFVYLTNYNRLVDANFTGNDGDNNSDNIPTYTTVQAAVNASSSGDIIFVTAGDYNERLVVNTANISIIGQDRDSTLIHCYPGDTNILGADGEAGGDMSKRCATYIQSGASGFTAENISFKNDYVYSTADGKSNKSADALRCDADGAVFVNVGLSSVQDTLYAGSGKQYYWKCRIEGLVDYIYSGDDARVFFNDCELVFVYESTKTGGYVCAPKTAADATYGLTFYRCVVTSEEGCNSDDYMLARPWGANAYVTWIDCYMGSAIGKAKSEPYSDMSGASYMAARFYEYGTYGPGYAINATRRQISPTKAADMITDSYLGWSPSGSATTLGNSYVGSVKTTYISDGKVETTYINDKYSNTEGNSESLVMYNQEGYASTYGVTGGGLLMETKENDEPNENYYKVGSAVEFLDALLSVKTSGKKSVIEITADLNLGCKELETAIASAVSSGTKASGTTFASYSSVIKAYIKQPLTHPTLLQTGVSEITLENVYNLTIFSQNGSTIKHANITMKNSGNIIIRNLVFDELWEWDEGKNIAGGEGEAGDYDRNDWDYMTIDTGTDGVWVDHCTFYKAYDGVIDVKNPVDSQRVTISWCEFLPGSKNNTFFNEMMDTMKNAVASNPDSYPYYKELLDGGMTDEQIWWYAYGQKKTHLLGQSNTSTNAVNIRVTLANNYYKNSMDRMPRLRFGKAHVYNCIMDAQELLNAKDSITNEEVAKHIVSNGASSTCDGEVLLENCYINGIINALNSGNGDSATGYINAINSVYYMYNVLTKLTPKVNNYTTVSDRTLKITNATTFKASLGYSYQLYDASTLADVVKPNAGAGKLTLSVVQWEKTSYGTSIANNDQWVDDTDYGTGDDNSSDNGSNSNGSDSNGSDDDYDSSDDNTGSGLGDGSDGTGSGSGSDSYDGAGDITNPTTTPVSDVLTASDIPGATVTKIDNANFAVMGDVSVGTSEIIAAVGTDRQVPSDAYVAPTSQELADAVHEALLSATSDNLIAYGSQNASLPASVVNSIRAAGKTLSVGIVDDSGKVNAILTLDSSKLSEATTDFNLKIAVDTENANVSRAAANYGLAMNNYAVVDFTYSGTLPGTFKIAADVSKKFTDGTQLALYYYNESAGRLENQYQITTVKNGYAEFAINHCSQYVLVDMTAVGSKVTSSVLSAPKTGDINHLVFWLSLMALAVMLMFGLEAARADEKRRAQD